jgi:spore coat protein A
MSKDEPKKFSRRKFLRIGALAGGAAVLGLTVGLPTIANLDKSGRLRQQLGAFSIPPVSASASQPQTALDPTSIAKYVDPVPVFVGARVNAQKYQNLTINNEEKQENILPGGFYTGLSAPYNSGTFFWGYSVHNGITKVGPSYPAFTIEARRNVPVNVTYVNSLENTFLQKYITVDQTIHWANPNNLGMMDSARQQPYTGPIPVVTHLHGGEVASTSDGGPDAWFTHGYNKRGPAWTYGGVNQNYTYPNSQEAATLFYHDHCLGATRLNLYAGLVGFYFIRDEYDTGIPNTGLNLPAGPYEIELAIQDKMFDTNGQLLFPDGTGGIGLNGTPPNPEIHPYWIPEFFGDVILVNAKSWPFLEVEPRRYRFRIADGANARFFNLTIPGLKWWIIGTDGGLLDKPVKVDTLFLAPGERADVIVDFSSVAGSALIVTNDARAPYPMGDAPDTNTNGQVMKFIVGTTITGGKDNSFDPAKTGATLRGGKNQPPAIMRLSNGIGGIDKSSKKIDEYRMITLVEVEGANGPLAPILNNTNWTGIRPDPTMATDGTPIPGFTKLGPNYLSELPTVGATEQWDIVNLTADAHPIHLHLVQFQLINRQNFNLGDDFTNPIDPKDYRALYDRSFPTGQFTPEYGPPMPYSKANKAGAIGGNPDVTPFLQGPIQPPEAWEVGWKDTFKMFPGQVTRIIVRWAPQNEKVSPSIFGKNKYPFDPTQGPGYVWHCHIVDHEDNEMMRPYTLKNKHE